VPSIDIKLVAILLAVAIAAVVLSSALLPAVPEFF
jgi:hypothetical protein